MRKMVMEYFRLPFLLLERNNLLNQRDERDLAALHYVFIPQTNENIEKVNVSWNSCKLSSVNRRLQTSCTF